MGEVSDDHAAAIAQQFESFSEAALGNPTPTIDGDDVSAIVENLEFDEIVVAGGIGERGGFRIMVALADLPVKPDEMAEVEVRGVTLHVLAVVQSNQYWIITVGDPGGTD